MFSGFCRSSLRPVLPTSCWAALRCLCAPVCSGRAFVKTMNGSLSAAQAISWTPSPEPLPSLYLWHRSRSLFNHIACSLASVGSHWPKAMLLHSHILQFCLLARQEPCEIYYRCYVVPQWSRQRCNYHPCCPASHANNPVMLYLKPSVSGDEGRL